MKTIGLTGGLGMGKSTAADLLRQRGVCVVDTDEIARQVTAPGQPALAEIRAAFWDEVFAADHTLRRAVLAEKVFSDAVARRQLEAILHPRIRALWQEQVARWCAEGVPLAVVVIPLLFETGAQAELDLTVCVGCSAAIQHPRLLSRGWSEKQIAQRQQAQLPLEKKMAPADHVLWNDGDRLVLAAQLDRLLALWR
jgi:dephospho-CoA kinase